MCMKSGCRIEKCEDLICHVASQKPWNIHVDEYSYLNARQHPFGILWALTPLVALPIKQNSGLGTCYQQSYNTWEKKMTIPISEMWSKILCQLTRPTLWECRCSEILLMNSCSVNSMHVWYFWILFTNKNIYINGI